MRPSFWRRAAGNPVSSAGAKSRVPSTRPPERGHTARLSVERLEDRTVPSTFTVLNLADAGDGSLRAAVLAAEANPGPDAIQFAHHVHGTVTLTTGELDVRSDLTINGSGASRLTVSGGDASRVFDVVGGSDAGGGIMVSISGLTVAHGRADVGGGIRNTGFSDLTLARVVLSENVAVGGPTAAVNARGGGLHSVGGGSRVSLVDSRVVGNTADGRPNATRGSGGGLSVEGGQLTVTRSTIADNAAFGGTPTISGAGGGLSVISGAAATVFGSTIRDNRSVGAVGGGPAHGGGILVTQASSLVLGHSLLTGNEAHGGNGSLGRGRTEGGGIDVAFGSRVSIADSVLTHNRAVAGSGSVNTAAGFSAATASGGAISVGVVAPGGNSLEVTRSVLRGNEALGGHNGTSTAPTIADVGSAHGGAIFTARGSVTVVRHSAVLRNRAVGGDGNTGTASVGFVGTATGGGLDNSLAVPLTAGGFQPARLTVTDSVVAGNEAVGGDGNTGSGAVYLNAGLGGGIANSFGATTEVGDSLVALNRATGGPGGLGAGGGIFNGAPTTLGMPALALSRTLVALNRAVGGPSGSGLGGGLYIAPGGVATAGETLFFGNDASTSDDDVFGILV